MGGRAAAIRVLCALAQAGVLGLACADELEEIDWDTTVARGQTRVIDFTTSEGTKMSVDISPDGRWLVFDLLAHIYRLPIEGGEARCLTQNSGVALNYGPRISPDGRTIAFISDRDGLDTLWIMDADGANPTPVFEDPEACVLEPSWTPDGEYLVVRRQATCHRGSGESAGLWMVHRDGGDGIELLAQDGVAWPSVAPDQRQVYFMELTCSGLDSTHSDLLRGCHQISRLDLKTGQVEPVTVGAAEQQLHASSGGGIAPEISPDGRRLAFARRVPLGTISFHGHRYGPRTTLFVRDLVSGTERMVMDPIEPDISEQPEFAVRVLPGYAWARDGKSIVLSQGGKLRRLWLDDGRVETIPFTARVRRTISEQVYARRRLSDQPFEVRFVQTPAGAPLGGELVFQAVGKLWRQKLPNGTPARLTPASFTAFEYAPAWSPDGRWIAFTSFDADAGGHLWRIAADGQAPERLTSEPGEYLHPVWSPDGDELVVVRGSGASARGRGWEQNSWYELIRLPAGGGTARSITRVAHPGDRWFIVRPSFGPEGRVFYPESRVDQDALGEVTTTELVSIRLDGSDRTVHLEFPYAAEVTPSPDGKWVAFQEGLEVYVMPFPYSGTAGVPPLIDKRQGQLPIWPVSTAGGLFPRWRDRHTLELISGNAYRAYDLDSDQETVVELKLSLPRDLPSGSLALRGARILTCERGQIIERGDLVVRGGRITCVGACQQEQVDRVVELADATIIPGLIDVHAHHHNDHAGIVPPKSWEQAAYLAYGVTTTLDPYAVSPAVFPTAELIEAGLVLGPRDFSTGEGLTQDREMPDGDGPFNNAIDSPAAAQQTLQRLADWGAISVKSYMLPRRQQRQWVIETARKLGLLVTGEAGSLEYTLSLVMDGQTGWEHDLLWPPIYGDVAKFIGRAGATYSATFMVSTPGPWNEEYFYQTAEPWNDAKLRRFTPWWALLPHTRRHTWRPPTDYGYALFAQALADIIAAGGYGAIGAHGQQHGIGSHWEVWMAAEALGPMGALEVATRHGARFLGLEQDLGTIATGKLADLVVLNANPLDDIRNTTKIRYVMKAGTLYDGDTLDELWPDSKPFGEVPWSDPDLWREDDRSVDVHDP
jgi:Tol biopolymer transport system component